jgi:PAS domain S-box-containing protein
MNRYFNLVEHAADGIAIIQDGVFKFVNSALVRMSGYDEDELIGMPFTRFIAPEYQEPVASKHREQLAGKGVSFIYEAKVITKYGAVRDIEINAALTEYEGRVADEAIIRDITERKRREIDRKELEWKTQLASRLATVGEMASGVAHEMNNLLTVISGYADLLLERDIPQDVREDVEVIHKGARRVSNIMGRLLSFARQHKPERKYANINDFIENTLAIRAYEMETNNIKVTTQLAPDLPKTMADAVQLQQVLFYLILNAETEMKLAHGKGNLLIKTETVDSNIRISVTDDGPGIAEENLERIFDPFFTARESGEETGLGLSVCHGIITKHGGKIYATSELDKGTTLIVELPIVNENRQIEPTDDEPSKTVNMFPLN